MEKSFLKGLTFTEVSIGAVACLIIILILSFVIFIEYKNIKINKERLYKDSLTGLWNFNWFRLQANKILEDVTRPHYALIYIDIDNFKYINDVFGYSEGDKILRGIANSINDFTADGEISARISADHFVVLLKYVEEQSFLFHLQELYEKIKTISDTHCGCYKFYVSGGIYVIRKDDYEISSIIGRANHAREIQDNYFQNTYAMFNDELSKIREIIIQERKLEIEKERALNNGEFVPFLQPKVDMNNNKIVGIELLSRWLHPEKGLLPPDNFIPLFEKDGFIVELDLYMFEKACERIREVIDDSKPVVPISCNFSRLNFLDLNFPKKLKKIIDCYNIPAKYLEIEITETFLLNKTKPMIALLEELKEIGFLIAIDDFGCGYSSLSLLKDLPVDVIKLDKSFIEQNLCDRKDKAIIQAMVYVTTTLNLQLVCEGVETIQQAEALKEIGCKVAQGYLYSKPVPQENLEKYYNKDNKTYTILPSC